MIALRMAIYSLAMIVLLFLTIILLPETLKINVNISIGLFVLIVTIFLKVSNNKWWVNIVSAVLGLVGFMVLIVLLSP
jgi:vacuolar-type H+-ATPase subunit I/STV1